jgi:nardilysin
MVGCLSQQMVEDVYPAEVALLNNNFYAGERGIVLKLNGLNDKLPLLLETILSHFAIFESKLTDEMFKAVRDQESIFSFRRYHLLKCCFSLIVK